METCNMLNKIYESLFANSKRSDSQAGSSVLQPKRFLIIYESRYQYENIKYVVPIVNVEVIVDSQKELIERIYFLWRNGKSGVKNKEDRVVILNRVASSVIEAQRGKHSMYVFPVEGKPIHRMNNSAWDSATASAT